MDSFPFIGRFGRVFLYTDKAGNIQSNLKINETISGNIIKKLNNTPVAVNYFANSNFHFVSGVLFSDKTILNHPVKIGDDCVFINNPFANNPVDESFVMLFKNWTASKNENGISLEKHY